MTSYGLSLLLLIAAGHRGVVKFGGLPVPGATVTATQANSSIAVLTDPQGAYAFPDLPGGTWTLAVRMTGFSEAQKEIAVSPDSPALEWELKMLPLEAMNAQAQTSSVSLTTNAQAPAAAATPTAPGDAFANLNPDELQQRAADGFLINGSTNNAAASPFSQSPAFGNNRRGAGSMYTGNLGVILGNSALDARPFSLTGQNTPRPDYNRVQGLVSFGGPLRIPHLLRRNGPNLILNWVWLLWNHSPGGV